MHNRTLLLLLTWASFAGGAWAHPFGVPGVLEHHKVLTDGRLMLYYEAAALGSKSGPIPIRIQYASGPVDANSTLPGGWIIPFIDSSVQQNSESTGQFLHPNGQTVPFKIGKDGASISGPEGMTGTIRKNVITINGQDYKLSFEDGRIKRFDYDSSSIVWEYKNNALARIVTDNDELIISNRMSGLINELHMKGKGGDAKVTYAKGSQTNDVLDSLGMNMVSEIKGFSGAWVFEHEVTDGLKKLKVLNRGKTSHDYEWDGTSGDTKRVDSLLYNVMRFSDKTTSPEIKTFSKKDGWSVVQPGVDYDQSKDVLTNHLPNGDLEHVHYVTTDSGRQVRKKVVERSNGEIIETYRAQFGADGHLLKDKSGEYERRNVDGRIQVWKNGAFLYQY